MLKLFIGRFVRAGEALAHLPELHGEKRQPLAEVVVQFSRNPGTFVFLCADQTATQFENAFSADLRSVMSMHDPIKPANSPAGVYLGTPVSKTQPYTPLGRLKRNSMLKDRRATKLST